MFYAVASLPRVLRSNLFLVSLPRLAGALVLAGLLSGVSSPAWSQAKQANALPAFAFPRDDMRERAARENWTSKPVPVPQAQNPYLGGILQLQDQIELIKKLSERQETLAKLRETYGALGIPFTAPPPTRSVCEKIPPSLVCVEAYPDLLKVAMPMEDLGENLPVVPSVAVAPTPDPGPVEDVGPDYRWTDVSCAGGTCRAVIVEADDGRARRTVAEGDTLSDGETVVSRIAFEGVRVTHGGKDWALMPAVAPSRGGSASPLFSINRASTGRPAARKSSPVRATTTDGVTSVQDEAAKKFFERSARSAEGAPSDEAPEKNRTD